MDSGYWDIDDPGCGTVHSRGSNHGALAGAGAGAAAGGLTGALIGMGMPEYEAKQYEEKMKGGNILISMDTEDDAECTRMKEIFKNAGAVTAAEDIVDRAHGTQSAPARKVVSPAVQHLIRDPNLSEPDAVV